MTAISRKRIRLLCNIATTNGPQDAVSGRQPAFWNGNDVQFEIGVFYGDQVQDISELTACTVQILTAVGGDLLAQTTVDVSAMNNTLTASTWNAKTAQHITVPFTSDQMNIDLGELAKLDVWIIIAAQTSHSPARRLTLAAGLITCMQDGLDEGGTPPDPEAEYYTSAEADARFMLKSDAGANTRWHTDGNFYIRNADNPTWWHPLIVKGDPSEPYFEPAPGVIL